MRGRRFNCQVYVPDLREVDLFAETAVHCLFDGAENVFVSRAAAEMAGKQFPQFRIGIKLVGVQDLRGGHDEARSAEAALDGGLVDESLLDVGKFPVRTFQPFQCQDGLSFRPDG